MTYIPFNHHLGYRTVTRVRISTLLCFDDSSRCHFFQVGQRSRPVRSTAGTRLADAIAAEKLDEYGSSCRRFILPRSTKRKRPATTESHCDAIDTDPEDETFAISVSEGGSDDDSDINEIEIGNDEVWLVSLLISVRANLNIGS
jgi:hypothetical protein